MVAIAYSDKHIIVFQAFIRFILIFFWHNPQFGEASLRNGNASVLFKNSIAHQTVTNALESE